MAGALGRRVSEGTYKLKVKVTSVRVDRYKMGCLRQLSHSCPNLNVTDATTPFV